jgi:hypothetical protein
LASTVTTVIIEGYTSIGDNSFQSSGLTSLNIPNSITSIGDYAFNGSGLNTATIYSSTVKAYNTANPNNTLPTSSNYWYTFFGSTGVNYIVIT